MQINKKFEKELANYFVYDSWQFALNTEKTIGIIHYCADVMQKLINQMVSEHVEWKNDLFDNIFSSDREEKSVTVTEDMLPGYGLNILGIELSYPFLLDKTIKDFFQYTRNTFDSMSQMVNSSILANKSKKRDIVDFPRMLSVFNQQTYSILFPDIQNWYNDVSKDSIFQYIDAFNNRTKHTCDVHIDLSMSLFNDNHTSKLSTFYKSSQQQIERNILDIVQDILDFTENRFKELIRIIENEIKKEVYTANRYHHLFCYQQKMKNDPNSELSVVYIPVGNERAELPNTIRILLLNNSSDDIWTKNCQFKNIFVRGSNEEYIGMYIRSSSTKQDTLIEYAEYKKVEKTPFYGWSEVWQAYSSDKTFYKSNPYISVTTVSDDEEFIKRVQIPF